MNFIIIGDKYQKGMKSKGCAGLIKIDESHNLFEYQYNIIKKYFTNSTIVYIGGFEYKKIESFLHKHYKDVICINNEDYECTNDAHSISLAKNIPYQNTFIMCGYTVLDKKIFDKFDADVGSQIFINKNSQTPLGCILNDNKVSNISFDLPNCIDNIYYVCSADYCHLQKTLVNTYYKNYFIFELLNQLIDSGSIIKPYYYKSNHKNQYYEYIK